MKVLQNLLVVALTVTAAQMAQAAVSAQEAEQLGTSLTRVGAEKAANAAGTIPEFTGGLPVDTAPGNYHKGDAMRPDPFANEKPVLVINAKNMAEHKDQLTSTTLELLSRYPDYAVNVYPTHRSVTLPQPYLDNSVKNATGARSVDGGMGMENALPGVPFPIPLTGTEVMWNHLLRYQGHTLTTKFDSWNVDSAGSVTLATTGEGFVEFPLSDPGRIAVPAAADETFYRMKLYFTGPARRVGESQLLQDSVNPLKQPRRAWQYLPGQRRVKLAPDLCCDTPNPVSAGISTYDDAFVFSGEMNRFDWKLVGKKEMYVPYNSYKLTYAPDTTQYIKPDYIAPEMTRWELHRVWVVEATLKPDARHIYHRRTFYVDEDSWVAVASDEYDARDQLYRGSFAFIAPSWDVQAANAITHMLYDLMAGTYSVTGVYGPHGGVKYIDKLSKAQWSPESLAGAGIR
ncbi:MAG: DUF1329 domain-containing protein [Pseudomonas sp.]|uniref:DUF1329 domain-containing protein n=1 Tax=Pseudomonas sp. TaxID=306 RepID=UPI003BB5728B